MNKSKTKTKKLKIAITGNIGSGKSSFAQFIQNKGYPVIYADIVSKVLLSKDDDIRKKIIREFGKEAYLNGEPDKDFLARKVFSSPENVIKINSILHPAVKKKILKLTDQYFEFNDIVFTEAALIYEADMEKMFRSEEHTSELQSREKLVCR